MGGCQAGEAGPWWRPSRPAPKLQAQACVACVRGMPGSLKQARHAAGGQRAPWAHRLVGVRQGGGRKLQRILHGLQRMRVVEMCASEHTLQAASQTRTRQGCGPTVSDGQAPRPGRGAFEGCVAGLACARQGAGPACPPTASVGSSEGRELARHAARQPGGRTPHPPPPTPTHLHLLGCDCHGPRRRRARGRRKLLCRKPGHLCRRLAILCQVPWRACRGAAAGGILARPLASPRVVLLHAGGQHTEGQGQTRVMGKRGRGSDAGNTPGGRCRAAGGQTDGRGGGGWVGGGRAGGGGGAQELGRRAGSRSWGRNGAGAGAGSARRGHAAGFSPVAARGRTSCCRQSQPGAGSARTAGRSGPACSGGATRQPGGVFTAAGRRVTGSNGAGRRGHVKGARAEELARAGLVDQLGTAARPGHGLGALSRGAAARQGGAAPAAGAPAGRPG